MWTMDIAPAAAVLQEQPLWGRAAARLHSLGRRVVVVVVRLVVLVPLVARVHPVEVLGLARPVLLVPPVDLPATSHAASAPALLQRPLVCWWLEIFHHPPSSGDSAPILQLGS